MSQSPSELPTIHLIPLGYGIPVSGAPRPTDLRWVRVEEFFQARSLAANTEKAYRRELKRFLQWTERGWSDLTPRQVGGAVQETSDRSGVSSELSEPGSDGVDEFL